VTDRRMERICLSTLNSSTQFWKHGPSWKHQSLDKCPGCVLIWQTARNRCRHVWVHVGSCVAADWSRTTAPRFSRCSVADGCCTSTTRHHPRTLTSYLSEQPLPTDHIIVDLSVVGVEMRTEVVSLDEQNEVGCVEQEKDWSKYRTLGNSAEN